MTEFVQGLDLAERFYTDAVRPILDQHFPDIAHGAALIGAGSEVLGFDTEMSSDHHWGPRVMLFLRDLAPADDIREVMANSLPREFLGYSTNFEVPEDDPSTTVLVTNQDRPIAHRVEIYTARGFFTEYLGFDPLDGVGLVDWLATPSQRLRTMVAGCVFRDDGGELTQARAALEYYPDQVWRYMLANAWRRIDQEEPMMGRTGSVGDEIGSHITAMRLVRDVMRLCFLMEREYAPYIKWFGTAFARLRCAPILMPHIETVMRGSNWQEREVGLTAIYEMVAQMHNDLGLTAPLPTKVSPFFNRPFQVIHAGAFAEALHASISDPAVRALPAWMGGIDQWVDSTDVLSYPAEYRKLIGMY